MMQLLLEHRACRLFEVGDTHHVYIPHLPKIYSKSYAAILHIHQQYQGSPRVST